MLLLIDMYQKIQHWQCLILEKFSPQRTAEKTQRATEYLYPNIHNTYGMYTATDTQIDSAICKTLTGLVEFIRKDFASVKNIYR